MRTDTELIELHLLRAMDAEEQKSFARRRASDSVFRRNVIAQAKVHLAVLLYGRNLRRSKILTAGEAAFEDPKFRQLVKAIFP